MKVLIENIGCDDETRREFDVSNKEFDVLSKYFELLNEKSTYGCMPKIYIKQAEKIE